MFLHVIVTLKLAFTKFKACLSKKGGLGVVWSFGAPGRTFSGVIMNSLVEWVVENKDNDNTRSLELIQHLQKDIGYLLQRLGLAQ